MLQKKIKGGLINLISPDKKWLIYNGRDFRNRIYFYIEKDFSVEIKFLIFPIMKITLDKWNADRHEKEIIFGKFFAPMQYFKYKKILNQLKMVRDNQDLIKSLPKSLVREIKLHDIMDDSN